MTEGEHQQVIDALQAVIDETQQTIDRFACAGMEEQMEKDYEALIAILNDAVKQQREHTLAMLR